MKSFTAAEILDLPMQDNDAGALTVRAYLIALLAKAWEEGEGFSGKRPFGNSDWEWELFEPLLKAGMINGKIIYDDDGDYTELDIDDVNVRSARRLIADAIRALGAA